ncbi:MAG: succinoglycan biosynthesis protein exop, partial [Mesorhizobium sp.]
ANDELTARLDELRKGVETAERNVEDFRATHDLVDAQGHLISDDQMLKLNEQLSVARARTLELNARAASARSLNVNSVLSGTLPEEINSNMMSELRSQYAALKQEADRAEVKLGPRHPEIEALNAQLAGARERISAELQRIASSLQVDLKRSVQLEQDLSSRLAQAKVQSGDVNNNLVSLRELEREAAAKRSVYEQFLLRAKETGEQKDINTANISVISEAYAPLQAKGPSRAVLAVAGLFAGLFAGIGLGGLRGVYAS